MPCRLSRSPSLSRLCSPAPAVPALRLRLAGSFTISTSGFPKAAITESGALPGGVSFTDNHDGTAKLAGTPAAGGVFNLTFTANNGVTPNATQSFTLTVPQSPAITSAATTAFKVGSSRIVYRDHYWITGCDGL